MILQKCGRVGTNGGFVCPAAHAQPTTHLNENNFQIPFSLRGENTTRQTHFRKMDKYLSRYFYMKLWIMRYNSLSLE